MTCPNCGRAAPDGSTSCAHCGASLTGDSSIPTRITPPADPAGGDSIANPTIAHQTPASGQLSAAAYEKLEPGARLGTRYEIISVLGVGGMGVVYRARDLTLQRDVALKVIRPDLVQQESVLPRFRREILLASKITHKNILRIHDLGETEGLAFLSMAYVEGETLDQLIEREGNLTTDRAVELAIQLCGALQAAHDAGVVHRDLKPQNILLDRDGNAYIADFGLSRSLEGGDTMTQSGAILGTFAYMAPEQASGETSDNRTDLYSFGLILYKMLTGTLPFRTDNAFSSMMKRVHEDAPQVRKIRKEIPTWLSSLVSRCLQRDPELRYQNAADVLDDLESRRAAKTWRWIRRPRVLLRAAGILLAAALVAAGIAAGIDRLIDRRQTQITPKTSLALLPFRNGTGDPAFAWIGTGIPDLIRTDLRQAKALRLAGGDRVQGILDGLKIGGPENLDHGTIIRVTGLLGVENSLTGTLLKAGDRFRIEAEIRRGGGINPEPGTPIRVEGSGEESIFTMIDQLAERVREILDITPGWGEKDLGVTELSTRSVEALRLYEEGMALVRDGNHLRAAELLESSLENDPGFGSARAALAETYDRLGYSDKALAEAERAVRDLKTASPFETARIRAVRARLGGDAKEALAAYRRLIEAAPNNPEVRFDLASLQEQQGDLELALDGFQRVLELDPKNPQAHFAVGRVRVKLGNAADAMPAFNMALGLYLESGNAEGRARVINGLGLTSMNLGRYEEALRYFRESLGIREKIGDRRGVGSAWTNIALIRNYQGLYEEAIEAQKRAIAIGREIGDRSRLGERYTNLGDIYQRAGNPEKALEAYHESLKIVREIGDEPGLAWNLSSVGYINVVLGRYLEAFFFLRESLDKSRKVGEKGKILRSLVDIGFVEQVQGRYEEALKYIMEGLALAREGGSQLDMGVLSANLSNIHEDQGMYGSALEAIDGARTTAKGINANDLAITCLAYQGSIMRKLGDHTGSWKILDEGLRRAREIASTELIVEIQTSRGVLFLAMNDPVSAKVALEEAVESATRAGNHRLLLLARLSAAGAEKSIEDMKDVLRNAETSGLAPLVTPARLALARMYRESGKPDDALLEAELAIESATPLGQRDLLFQAHFLAGTILVSRGWTETAVDHFTAALTFLEEMLRNLDGSAGKHLLARKETAAFADAAKRLFQENNRSSEQERLRTLLQQ